VIDSHEPIISVEQFNTVQYLCRIKKRPRKDGTTTLFQGIVICADCGWRMSFSLGSTKTGVYRCSKYSIGNSRERPCTYHRIGIDILEKLVLSAINPYIEMARNDNFITVLEQSISTLDVCGDKRNSDRMVKRKNEINATIKKLLEQNANGVINDDMFSQLYSGYQVELHDLTEKIDATNCTQRKQLEMKRGVELFASLISIYKEPLTCLTREIVLQLIEKIVVYEPIGKSHAKHKTYKVDIHFKGIGFCASKSSLYAC
jgi:hypothetical protein